MELSRKRRKELKRLRGSAERLWLEQKEVLAHAGKVAQDAKRIAPVLAQQVSPALRGAYAEKVRPAVATRIAATRAAAGATRAKMVDEVIPALSSALGTASGVMAAAKDPRVRAAVLKASQKPATKSGAGRYLALGVGLLAAGGLAYAAWQTLRADDDLWVEDSGPEPVEPPERQLDDL